MSLFVYTAFWLKVQKLTVHWLGKCQRDETFRGATAHGELALIKILSRYLHYF